MSQEKSKATLPLLDVACYTLGGMFSLGVCVNFISYFTMAFLTNGAGLSTAVAATIYSFVNILKLVSMLISGVVIDGSNMKNGKFRTWQVIGAAVMVLTTGVVFTKLPLSESAYTVVFLVLFFVNQFGYNLAWTSNRSLVGPMSKTSADGILLTSAAQVGSSGAGVIYGIINAPLMALFATSFTPFGGPAAVYSVVVLCGALLTFVVAKKYEVSAVTKTGAPAGNKVSFLDMLKTIKGQGLIFLVGTTFGNIQSGFFMTLLFYFTTYVLKNDAALGLAVTWSSVGGFVGAFLAPAICSKFSKKTVYIVAHYVSAALYILMFLVGRTAVPFFIIRVAIGFVGTFGGVTLPALGNDLADYNEMKGESNARAFVQSLVGASIRIGTIVSGSISAYGLAVIGFDASKEVTASMETGIAALMGVAPAVVCVLAAIVISFFKVDENELDAYRKAKAANK